MKPIKLSPEEEKEFMKSIARAVEKAEASGELEVRSSKLVEVKGLIRKVLRWLRLDHFRV